MRLINCIGAGREGRYNLERAASFGRINRERLDLDVSGTIGGREARHLLNWGTDLRGKR